MFKDSGYYNKYIFNNNSYLKTHLVNKVLKTHKNDNINLNNMIDKQLEKDYFNCYYVNNLNKSKLENFNKRVRFISEPYVKINNTKNIKCEIGINTDFIKYKDTNTNTDFIIHNNKSTNTKIKNYNFKSKRLESNEKKFINDGNNYHSNNNEALISKRINIYNNI